MHFTLGSVILDMKQRLKTGP